MAGTVFLAGPESPCSEAAAEVRIVACHREVGQLYLEERSSVNTDQIIVIEPNPNIEDFRPGDTVRVSIKITEGDRRRTQVFPGGRDPQEGRGVGSLLHRSTSNSGHRGRAHLSASFADGGGGEGRAARRGAPRSALLPQRPFGQGGPNQRRPAEAEGAGAWRP